MSLKLYSAIARQQSFKSTRRLLVGLAVVFFFVVVIALGRFVQVALGSFYEGERGPYLQLPAATKMTVRWRTIQADVGVIRFGLQPDQLDGLVQESRAVRAHEVRLTNLQPNTRYYYAIGPTNASLYGGDNFWFTTSPETGHSVATRFLVLGDPGYAGPAQKAVRDEVQGWLNRHSRFGLPDLDFLLTTGDNAYKSGSNKQFQKGFFEPYAIWFRNAPVWPVYGNHDARRWAFFKIFSLPADGESGGIPSGTEHYYAFDYGQVHVVVLDTQESSLSAGSKMLVWLKKDLVINIQPWVIVAFHHPPYSHGSHNSDNSSDSGGRMSDIRQTVVPLLEKHGVDLVLSGHSHMYERSYFHGCQQAASEKHLSLLSEDNQEIFGASPDGSLKNPCVVYLVLGSSSKVGVGSLDHPLMKASIGQIGAVVIDVNKNQLESRFITQNGEVLDTFTIIKSEQGVKSLVNSH